MLRHMIISLYYGFNYHTATHRYIIRIQWRVSAKTKFRPICLKGTLGLVKYFCSTLALPRLHTLCVLKALILFIF